jgi:cold shock CspA family protein
MMSFRDQKLVCKKCGRTFFFTVTEQRRLAETVGQDAIEPPERCPGCSTRAPTPVRIAEESIREEILERPKPPPPSPAKPAAPVAEFPLTEEGIEVKLIGTVKWFSVDKGYGFITKADGQDVFFHRADVLARPLSRVNEDQQVEFQLRQTDKGLEAFNVSILPEP